MIGLRARQGWCAKLALFALALQLVTSFGHVHRKDGTFYRASVTQIVADAGLSAGRDATASASREADSDAGDAVSSICQTCFTLAQISAGKAGAASPLAHPLTFADASFAFVDPKPIANVDPTSFWSRGPPIS